MSRYFGATIFGQGGYVLLPSRTGERYPLERKRSVRLRLYTLTDFGSSSEGKVSVRFSTGSTVAHPT